MPQTPLLQRHTLQPHDPVRTAESSVRGNPVRGQSGRLTQINADDAFRCFLCTSDPQRSMTMTTGETIYLAIVLATFFGFMAMLATHSIQYQRDRDRTER